MAKSLNKVMIIGNVTKDIELRYTQAGSGHCSFSVATNYSFKDKDGKVQEKAEFISVTAWGKLAEICSQLLAKGAKVYVEGRLQTREWKDEKTDTNRRITEVVADQMIVLNSKPRVQTEEPIDN